MADKDNKEEGLEKTSIVPSESFRGRIQKADDSPPVLVCLMGPAGYVGKQWAITDSEMVIGRAVECQIFVDDRSVSRTHAKVALSLTSEVSIMDLNSSNKTLVGEQTIQPLKPVKLDNNAQIKTGNVIFKYLEQGNIEALSNKDIYDRAHKDALTGTYSRGALLHKGPEVIKRSEVLGEPLSVIVFDIDFFKKVNDNYGHDTGDYVLKELAKIVSQKVVRANDFFARYGGEEFVIILNGAPISQALEIAERIRTTVQSHRFNFNNNILPITVSLGVAALESSKETWDMLFKKADLALYTSKNSGRNRVSSS